MKRIVLFGSTGHVGRKVLEVVREYKHNFKLIGLSANENYQLLLKQAEEFGVKNLALRKESLRGEIKKEGFNIYYGTEGMLELLDQDVDLIILAIAGVEALTPLLYALEKGIDVALASKEALIAGGELISEKIQKAKSKIIPLDSEHNAIYQIIHNINREEISAIYLTCSGGPFLNSDYESLDKVTPQMAVSHPRWKMGKKISIDSATLLNKGFEIIEAHYLFQLPPDKIKVLIHPQAIIHGLVELKDGNIFAHLAETDMKVPIAYALGYPQRMDSGLRLDWGKNLNLELIPPDLEKFPALRLAYYCLENKKSFPAFLVKLDELVVAEFLEGRIKFTSILKIIEAGIKTHRPREINNIEDLDAVFKEAQQVMDNLLKEVTR
jgi:1-deoxy-D-xylulose-5-phosphate reductoisomerase